MLLRIPGFLVLLFLTTFGPELRLGGFRSGGARSDEGLLHVARRGDGYLAFYSRGRQIRTVRIDAAGRTDLGSTRVVLEPERVRPFLRAAGDGVVYFWLDQGGIYYTPADPDGVPTSPAGILLAGNASFNSAQCNGTHCLVTYFDLTTKPAVQRAAIATIGQPIIERLDLPNLFYRPVGGVDDGGFLLVGLEGEAFHAVRIDNGARVTFNTVIQTGDTSTVAFADFDGRQYTLVWSNSGYPHSENATFIAHLSLDGTLSDRRKLFDNEAGSPVYGILVWTGVEHRLAYNIQRFRYPIPEASQPAEIRVLRLGSDLAPIGTPLQITDAVQGNYAAALAVNGRATYLGWNEVLNGGFQATMRGALIDAQGNVAAREPLAVGPLPQIPAAIAASGDQILTLWTETDLNAERTQLRFARVTRGGALLDGSPRFAADAPSIGSVAAAAAGSDWLVVWNQTDNPATFAQSVRGAIIHAEGSLREIVLPPLGRFGPLSIATDGDSWVVVDGVRAVRVARSGLVLTPNPVQFGGTAADRSAIAWEGEHYLAAWNGFLVPSCAECAGQHVALLNADLTIAVADKTLSPQTGTPSLAFNGKEYLLESTQGRNVVLTRLSRSGVPVGAPLTLIRPAFEGPFDPIAVQFGNGWLATWRTASGRLGLRVGSDGSAGEPIPIDFTHVLPSNGDTIIGMTSRPIDGTPAVFLQEMMWQEPPRRRVAR